MHNKLFQNVGKYSWPYSILCPYIFSELYASRSSRSLEMSYHTVGQSACVSLTEKSHMPYPTAFCYWRFRVYRRSNDIIDNGQRDLNSSNSKSILKNNPYFFTQNTYLSSNESVYLWLSGTKWHKKCAQNWTSDDLSSIQRVKPLAELIAVVVKIWKLSLNKQDLKCCLQNTSPNGLKAFAGVPIRWLCLFKYQRGSDPFVIILSIVW